MNNQHSPMSNPVGKWRYSITNSGSIDATVQVQVSSRPASDAAPIVLRASVSSDTVDIADPSLSRIAIYGEVSQGYTPIVGATVVAYVDTSTGTHTLHLLDNGAGADNTKNDGIYTAYFLKFEANVTHSVRVVVRGEDGVSVKSVTGGQKALPMVTNTAVANAHNFEITYKPIDPFMRSDSGGLFTVKNLPIFTPGSEPPDLYPPGRIYDLTMEAVNTDNKTVTLSWTATGDDLDQGNASSYDIRYSTSVSDIRYNFMKSNKFLDDDLLQGKLGSPLPAGGVETFIVQFNLTVDHNITYFIALVATDDRNQSGHVSNIVSVSFVYMNPFSFADPVISTESETSAVDTTTKLTIPKSKPFPEELNVTGYIIAGVAVVVIIITTVAIALQRQNLLKG
ncbi:calcium-activated chloride channel regulator 4A-like [Lingula anatina]|uniref:Calcium-activated chloride channel regulator 4A-like n=1 Tax=Lingula anatina TaxID=7574 RepID=A0A1S3IDZ3_LINAN|nr:calcium-activated chloride channel regulator 4A-like [Lingula anatina]|eukprot:XP_013396071.1 calcium-activated chloride channel regulator 4A-like [Lingula anatina]